MPIAAPRPCTFPGCRKLAVARGRCADHPRDPWAKKPEATKRITGRRLQAMRAALFARDPLCARCRELGLVVLATQRDHVTPLEEGGADDATNEQGLCDDCHREKSLGEALRGRRRARLAR